MPFKTKEARRHYLQNRKTNNPEGYARSIAIRNEHRASIRRFLSAVKVTAGCIDCGFDAYPAAMDFDHRDDEVKSFGVSSIGYRSKKSIIEEMMKCDVRCANCHRIRTHGAVA